MLGSLLMGDLQILDIVKAWALSTLVMEGCITPSDSYAVSKYLSLKPHTWMAQTFKKYDKHARFPPPDGAEYNFTLD